MGAKQSKRSVDISGKEAENAGEVAVAGAGGEGRMEPLADADALKPQLNGDAHIHEASDKEKQLDAATPENEKDATTEKEGKEDKEKEAVVAAEDLVTNGEIEKAEVAENGDSTPAATPEDGKKPKKEKVKKKWSLRSISFSRKDKPKQEKKQKEEEPKTNGESDKVPEEAAEVIPEAAAKETAEEAKPDAEAKEEKSPVTPVTEPITNGSSTPETPKEESPAPVEAPAPTPAPVAAPEEKPEPKAVPEPEQLPVNGLSLEETKAPEPEVVISEESKPEEPTEATETVPAPEIPAKIEVCEQIPLIESTPPPLPANPPPSSVASFAATTMAPELTDASLPNTELAMPHPSHSNIEPEIPVEPPKVISTESITQLPPRLKESSDEIVQIPEDEAEKVIKVAELNTPAVSYLELKESDPVIVDKSQTGPVASEIEISLVAPKIELSPVAPEIELSLVENVIEAAPVEESVERNESEIPAPPEDITVECNVESSVAADDQADTVEESTLTSNESPADKSPEPQEESIAEDFPPPPPLDDDLPTFNDNTVATETTGDSETHHTQTNGIDKIVFNGNGTVEEENIKNKAKDPLGNVIEKAECNGNLEEAAIPPPASPTISQEPVSVSDKMADLIPEIPAVPELSTEVLQETSSDVAVAN